MLEPACLGQWQDEANFGNLRPTTPTKRVLKEWVLDAEPPGLRHQTARFFSDWSQAYLSEVDLGDRRILVPCFD